ncbi:hypothetical protein N657DRAFT_589876 [Parathielavia appendiculata]|uniref:Uncharacterized protein n=1 Tax=Parathielavia appendiculata TaxID=2587402 RepID=A0AAN6U6V8_9PEZI|nr:hypothetical protein N657DRAFT_589876 [Parathielavia appendiculata]
MAATLEETMVSYEELADLEQEFDDVETEIIRQQYALSKPLYAKRAELVSKIPNFWPLVLEQAPMDIDEYIQPSDSAVLLSSLKSLSVRRFELDEDEKNGDPRSVAIRFEFAENEHFEDTVLEKKFWWRYSKDGFAGLVSEPVEIRWKKGKDLTDGLLGLVKAVYDEQMAKPKQEAKDERSKKVELTEKQKALKEKMENTGMGGVSFFAWFGYIGEYVTAEESKAAVEEEREERRKRKAGEEVAKKKDEDEDEEMEDDKEEDDDDEDDDLEIFPTGDQLAMAIADDLWPAALKYFIQAQEDDLSEGSHDWEDDEEDDEEEEEGTERPQKKQKACEHGCKH